MRRFTHQQLETVGIEYEQREFIGETRNGADRLTPDAQQDLATLTALYPQRPSATVIDTAFAMDNVSRFAVA